jgi:hypothetical protein
MVWRVAVCFGRLQDKDVSRCNHMWQQRLGGGGLESRGRVDVREPFDSASTALLHGPVEGGRESKFTC